MLAYADDVALLSPSFKHAQHDLSVFAEACTSAGLTISIKKTKVMALPDLRNTGPVASEIPSPSIGSTPQGELWISVPNRKAPLQCPQCATTFKNDTTLRTHLLVRHGLTVNILSAPPTQAVLPNTSRVVGDTRWRCDECGATFAKQFNANRHWHTRKCHNSTGTTRYVNAAGNALEPPSNEAADYAAELRALDLDVPPHPHPNLFVGTSPLENVDSFKYLGSQTETSGHDSSALQARLKLASATLASIFPRCARTCTRSTRLIAWRAIAKAQVMFACETFTLSQKDRDTLDSWQQRWLRRITGMYPFIDQSSGQLRYPHAHAVLLAADEIPLSTQVDAQRLRFLGHCRRHPADSVVKRLLQSHIPMRNRISVIDFSWKAQTAALVNAAGMQDIDPNNRPIWKTHISRWLSRIKQTLVTGPAQPVGHDHPG